MQRKRTGLLFWIAFGIAAVTLFVFLKLDRDLGKIGLLVTLYLFVDYFLKADLKQDEE